MKLALARAAEFMPAIGEFDPEPSPPAIPSTRARFSPASCSSPCAASGSMATTLSTRHWPKARSQPWSKSSTLERFPSKSRLLVVEDSLLALQRLGAAVRRLWGKPLIGVTGSAGKTTTKETIAHVLATRYRVLKSQGNLNNHFGMPLQLLKLEPEHEIAVIEMGMSHAGEIAALAKLAEPDCGVVTMVAPVHLEFFESIAGIARAKYELIQSLPPGGIAVLNADDEYVSQFGRDFHGRVVTFGRHSSADVSAQNVESRGPEGSAFEIVADGNRAYARLPLLGEHNIYNALAGVAVGLQYGVSLKDAAGSLATLSAGDKRGEILHINGATVINDCYNSNPKALDSMVRSLSEDSCPAPHRHCRRDAGTRPRRRRDASRVGTTHVRCRNRCLDWRARVGEGHGRSCGKVGSPSGVCEHAGGSGRMVETRDQAR